MSCEESDGFACGSGGEFDVFEAGDGFLVGEFACFCFAWVGDVFEAADGVEYFVDAHGSGWLGLAGPLLCPV